MKKKKKNRVHPDFKQLLLTGAVDDIINDAHKNMGIHENKFTRLILTQIRVFFSKNAIDTNKLSGTLTIQAVGEFNGG